MRRVLAETFFGITMRKLLIVSFLLLGLSARTYALNLGQILSGAGVVARGMQESENRILQNKLLELQVQEANRMAAIQQLEYQRRVKELDETHQRELRRQQQLNVETKSFPFPVDYLN